MPNNTALIPFALFGYGHIGRKHAAIIRNHPEVTLVAVADPALPVVEDCPVYADPNDLLKAHPEVTVAVVATPNGLHAAHALLALEYGKHIVVEKPMALNKADCERILHQALQKNRQVFCVMQLRYSPVVQWLRNLIQGGALGRVFMVQVNCFWNRDDRYYTPGSWRGSHDMDGGPLYTQFSHFIDFLYWSLGELRPLSGIHRNFTHPALPDMADTGSFHFEFGNGGLGVFTYSTSSWDKNFESSISLLGEKGSVKIGGQYLDQVQYAHLAQAYPEPSPALPPNSLHDAVLQNVLDVLQGRGELSTNALEGMKVVEFIEKIGFQIN